MKRTELAQIIPLYATDRMIREAKADVGEIVRTKWGTEYKEYKTNLYILAKHEKEYLIVCMFHREHLKNEKRTPDFTIFFSKTEMDHLSFDDHLRTWKTGQIDSLNNGLNHHGWYMSETTVCYPDSEKVINKYLKEYTGGVLSRIRRFQEDVRKARMLRRDSKIIKSVDEAMEIVKKEPAGIKEWSLKNGFEEILFYQGKGNWKEAYCTHCGNTNRLFKPKHNDSRRCPSCNTRCTTKAFGRQKEIKQVAFTTVIQKYGQNKFVLRQFTAHRTLKINTNWMIAHDVRFDELLRGILSNRFVVENWYLFGQWRSTGVVRWVPREADRYGYYYNPFYRGVMYTKNIKKKLDGYLFTYSNFKKYMYEGPGCRKDNILILQRLLRYPYLEYVEKANLTNLANEMITSHEQEGLFDHEALDLKRALRINGQQIQRLREINGNSLVVQYLQCEGKEYLKPETLRYVMNQRIHIHELQTDRTHLSITKAVNLIKRVSNESQRDIRTVLQTYRDYLNMAEERGEDITDEIICKNARFIEFHDRYLEEKNAEKNKKRDDSVNKKFLNIRKNFQSNKKHFSYKSGNYQIVVPERASDITREGRLQHHCVGASDTYMSKMNKKETFIIFMRDIDNLEAPYYTLEVRWNGEIVQWYAAYDRKPNEKETEKWLSKFTAKIKKRTLKEKTA